MSQQEPVQASPRVSASLYIETRAWLLANDEDAQRMLDWSNLRRGLPPSAEKLVLNQGAGMDSLTAEAAGHIQGTRNT